MQNNNDLFLTLYNRLDALLRDYYNIDNRSTSCIKRYEDQLKHSSFEEVRDRGFVLESIRNIRNTLIHDAKINSQDAFYVNQEVVSFLQKEINYLLNPIKAKDVMIPFKDVYYVSKNSPIKDVIAHMSSHYISHAPILENRRVIGVFSESTLYTFLLEHQNISLKGDETISTFLPYCLLEKHSSERFMFVDVDLPILDLRENFVKNKKEKRLVMLFLTNSGNQYEPLLGILTAADFLKD